MFHRILCAIVIVLCATLPVLAATPDQVLVIYNADWTEDLVGTEPGQDSLEVAQYYVRMHTDPETGKKPYMLGLKNVDPKRRYLDEVSPSEPSQDNPWGLSYVGAMNYATDPKEPPRSVGAWGELIEAREFTSTSNRPDHALLVLSREMLERIEPRSDKLLLVRPGKDDIDLLRQRRDPTAVPWLRIPLPGGAVGVVVTLRGYVDGKATLRLQATDRETKKAVSLERTFDMADAGKPSGDKPTLPKDATFVEHLVSTESLRKLHPQMTISGFVIPEKQWATIDPTTVTVAFSHENDRDHATLLVDGGKPADGIGMDVYEMRRGERLVNLSIRRELNLSRAYALWVEGKDKQGKTVTLRHDVHVSPRDFTFTATGPDGIRDDQAYIDHIENPIKTFLEDPANRLPDGRLLKDHILYIVACYGLPHRVPALYGVRRGEPNNGLNNLGRGAALTQRLQAMYLKPEGVHVVPFRIGRGRAPVVVSTPVVLVRSQMVSPYVLNTIFQGDAKLQDSPPHFTSELRRGMPADRFLFGCTRIDGPHPNIAKRQVDSAVWASKHFTAKLGQVRGDTYRTATEAAALARTMGFEVPDDWANQSPKADRSAIVMGVFGYGPAYVEDIAAKPKGKSDTTAVQYLKGFKPGAWGYAVRSYLGWTRERNPDQFGRYHEMMLRAGVALTCGATGGAHDTSHSRYPDRTFLNLMMNGYEYGDAILKSSLYVNWVIDWYGDPLYRVDLATTTVPEPVVLKDASAIRVELVDTDRYRTLCAVVRADIGHAANTPRFACIRAVLKDAATGQMIGAADTLYTSAPEVALSGLAHDSRYELSVTLEDPYGRTFDAAKAFGPVAIKTSTPPEVVLAPNVLEADYTRVDPLDRTVRLDKNQSTVFQNAFTLRAAFKVPEDYDGKSAIALLSTDSPELGFEVGNARRFGCTFGGAKVACHEPAGDQVVFEKGRSYTVEIVGRKYPVVREMVLIGPEGKRQLLGIHNRQPWREMPTVAELKVGPAVTTISLSHGAPGPNPAGYALYPHRFGTGE